MIVLNRVYFSFNQNYKKFKMGTNSMELHWESFGIHKIKKLLNFRKVGKTNEMEMNLKKKLEYLERLSSFLKKLRKMLFHSPLKITRI